MGRLWQAVSNFNPRSREGSDRTLSEHRRSRHISIHAPARGATVPNNGLTTILVFQSTLPRGERPRPCCNYEHTDCNFNPRSREGSDDSYSDVRPAYTDFNPRSREGSDLSDLPVRSGRQYFNPRSREGSDEWPGR